MANPLRNLKNQFMPKTANELETATARLADLELQKAERIKLRGELSLAAVKSGMGEDELEAYRVEDKKLAELDGLIDATHRWIAELHAAEHQRQHEAQIKVNKTKLNAFTQQVRKLDRLEAEQVKNIQSLISNWTDREELAKSIEKLVPYSDWLNNQAFTRFKYGGMRRAEQRELCRQGLFGQGLSDYHGPQSYAAAETSRSVLGAAGVEDLVWNLPGMVAEGKKDSDWSIREFGRALGLNSDGTAAPVAAYKPAVAPKPVSATPKPSAPETPPQQPSPAWPWARTNEDAKSPLDRDPNAYPTPTLTGTPAPTGPASTGSLWDTQDIPPPHQHVLDAAAEATLAAVQGGLRNPHPPGSEAYQDYEQTMASMNRRSGSSASYSPPPLPPQPVVSASSGEPEDWGNVDPASLLPPGASFGGSLATMHAPTRRVDAATLEANAARTLDSLKPRESA